ncbi:hypothetical protein IWQ60_008452 [Tieghemiomyces parasiticus]|uniref:SMP-30/Gluconolactonase/LRE-like region domain-containing protein n=1 Tax=Tieghemiomyces parasiticus TaxID=78921 RepID=A0A9W8DLM0_9FUNG|nr:hypothetical protein IWQ60_008452 [Tieghemiomyces parasiticus]
MRFSSLCLLLGVGTAFTVAKPADPTSSSAAPAATGSGGVPVPTVVGAAGITAATSKFGAAIEGAGVDAKGNIYAVNYDGLKNNIGIALGQGAQSSYYQDPDNTTWFNGIRVIESDQTEHNDVVAMLAVDVTNHRVLRISGPPGNAAAVTYCQDAAMLQPNDIAVTDLGDVFLSGMNYSASTGDLWICPNGGAHTPRRIAQLNRTNGIEVDPTNKYLYLSESTNGDGGVVLNNVIWRYELTNSASGSGLDVKNGTDNMPVRTLFKDFSEFDNTGSTDIDGMRTDKNGNLYVTRNGLGEVVVFTPQGELKQRITVPFKGVTSLEFGGAQGTDLAIVGSCGADEKGCLHVHRVDCAGRAFSGLQADKKSGSH